jgi:hypothetical protein
VRHVFISLTHELIELVSLLPSLLPLLLQYAFNGLETRRHELVPSIHPQSSAEAPI